MFNSYEYNPTQKVNLNAVSGTLSRTCEKSFFLSCRVGSSAFERLMTDEPHLSVKDGPSYIYECVVVLQAMLMGDNSVMFELIKKSDYEDLRNAERSSHE